MSTRMIVRFADDLIEVVCDACGEVVCGREDSPVDLDVLTGEAAEHQCPAADYDDSDRDGY